jgi:hypothetical protein
MPEYRAYIIGPGGHFQSSINLECADDAEASEATQKLLGRHDVELWQGTGWLRSSSIRRKAKTSPNTPLSVVRGGLEPE